MKKIMLSIAFAVGALFAWEARAQITTNFDNAVLNNIEMRPDEYMNIGVGFILNTPINTKEEHQFVISQELVEAPDDGAQYGSDCIYVVVISDEEAEIATANRQATNDNVQHMASTANSVALTVKPNPTEGRALVQFNMPQNGVVSMTLTNASGRIVKSFGQKIPCVKGQNQLPIDVSGIGSGTYLVTITTPTGKQTAKLIIKQ
jgi:Secretion system C-terminal sorting domain